ncbi:MAG: hypothetical protein SZ59_C0005G0085 [candidate division TM6 bacterium GW2011_GWF2_28_16]|nr:MAG: hypothetical protein SZ59_C0005G0085 [candidate division TM6 bacterium GW2011_GWF2_28_16]
MKIFIFRFCNSITFYILKKLKEGIFIAFFFFVSCFSFTDIELVQIAKKSFHKNLPGFSCIINKLQQDISRNKNVWGNIFEIETALFFNTCLKQNILGFNLDIFVFDHKGKDRIKINLDNKKITLVQTEFDVITNNYCVEAKSGVPNQYEKYERQFVKEQNMLEWFSVITRELTNKTIKLTAIVDKRNKNMMLMFNGISTFGKNIYLKCNWINGKNKAPYLFLDEWHGLINILSGKKFCASFKNKIEINSKTEQILNKYKFPYIHSLDLENLKNTVFANFINLNLLTQNDINMLCPLEEYEI